MDESSGIGAVIGKIQKLSMKGGKLCITNFKTISGKEFLSYQDCLKL